MRKLWIALLLVVAVSLSGRAQKVVQKSLEVHEKSVEMKFQFADTITIEAWNQNRLELEVYVNIGDNRYNDYYDLKVREKGSKLTLEEVVDFGTIQKLNGNNQSMRNELGYKLKVPANLDFSLNTISGQVVLKGLIGPMKINSISGFIDYSVPVACKAQLELASVTGNLYSDLKFDEKAEKEMQWVGLKRRLSLNGGTQIINLKTVSGDIYLRKSK